MTMNVLLPQKVIPLSDLDIHGNIQPSGRMSTSAQNEVTANFGPFVDNTLPVTDPGNIK